MNAKITYLLLLCWLLVFEANGQTATRISYAYEGIPLEAVITDLQERYDLRFTYSPSRLPMDMPLYAKADKVEVPVAMETLFSNTPVKHAVISQQIVLRSDQGALSQLAKKPPLPRQTTPLYQEARHQRIVVPATPSLAVKTPTQLQGGDRWLKTKLEEEELARIAQAMEEHDRQLALEAYDATHRLAQISILPYLGTNTYRSDEVTNNISLNIFWGTSRAINGFELGGVANSVVQDMSGFQMAGVLNQVGGNVTGTQVAGGMNYTQGR
ncbi:MAG: hypothetical protein R2795_10300 [Saprospiraceae bacterium]